MSTATVAKYVFGRTFDLGFDEAIKRVTDEPAKERVGVLTEIDVETTLKRKLYIDVVPYWILGACNPEFAHKAMELVPQIGALLPCNVMVREDEGKTRVEIMDPRLMLQLVQRPEIEGTATAVRKRLERVLALI
ncbi:MAG: DUF302 domain-containing protein [Burkholderiales bacterium]